MWAQFPAPDPLLYATYDGAMGGAPWTGSGHRDRHRRKDQGCPRARVPDGVLARPGQHPATSGSGPPGWACRAEGESRAGRRTATPIRARCPVRTAGPPSEEITSNRRTLSPAPEVRTSPEQLLGTTTGMILTAVVAIVGLAVLLGMVFLADGLAVRQAPEARRRAGPARRPGPGHPAGQGHRPWEQLEDRHVAGGGHPHGKPASWVLVAVVMAASVTGGISIIAPFS